MFESIELPGPKEEKDAKEGGAIAYVRPHDIEVLNRKNGTPALEVVVQHVSAVGSAARLDLRVLGTDENLEAEIPRAQHEELNLRPGDRAYVKFRQARTFLLES